VRDAPTCAGAHPIVIYAPGLGNSAWDNADLCEYLASYGYLVIASPSLGAVTRAPSHDLEGIEPQARDISFLIGYARSLEHVDASRCAVIGFSWGGISNVVAAARDQRINALVCLDGSVRFSPGLVWKAGVAPHQLTIPLLSISQGQWSPEEKAALLESLPGHEGPDVLNAWTQGDLTTVLLLGFGHGDHSSMAQRNADERRLAHQFYGHRKVDYNHEDSVAGYAWLARYTLEFLNAYLKSDAAARMFLRKAPVENGAPPRLMTVIHRLAVSTPTLMDLRARVVQDGFDQISEVYERFRQEQPGCAATEMDFAAWAEALAEEGHDTEAVAVLRFNATLHSQSGGAWLALAHAYRRTGDAAAAVEAYRRVRGLPPWWLGVVAAEWLRVLSGESN
jgi:dienelactone hydrolase